MLFLRFALPSLAFLLLLLMPRTRGVRNSATSLQMEERCIAADGVIRPCLDENDTPLDYGEDFGFQQVIEGNRTLEIQQVMQKTRQYMRKIVFRQKKYVAIREECLNRHEWCAYWAATGECETNRAYMNVTCAPVCQSCDFQLVDPEKERELLYSGEDIGVKQRFHQLNEIEIQETLRKARRYLQKLDFAPKHRGLRMFCRNNNKDCATWAARGECAKTPGYMNVTCGPVCQACEYHVFHVRCPVDPQAVDAWAPGELDHTFENIFTQPENAQYEPKVLSRPDFLPGDDETTAPYKIGPWLISLQNVITEDESYRMIALGAKQGFIRSATDGDVLLDGLIYGEHTAGRTSSSSWCDRTCYTDAASKALTTRLTEITNSAEQNMDYFQFIRYEEGQYYHSHHDFRDFHVGRPQGVRVLTMLIYLNDVEEGGGTNFPALNLTIVPQRGRALIWPNVLNEDLITQDNRTMHQALPVLSGIKYGTLRRRRKHALANLFG